MRAKAYYNEIDPFAAAWLRELIKRDLIADGDVDERSIVDVRPSDLDGYTQCHFFAGIGGWSYALRLAGWPDDRQVWTGSCPCQPFSQAGKGDGADDSRHLWPAWFRLIKERAPVEVFGEQVASADGLAWLDAVASDLESQGYAFGPLSITASALGAPHERKRLWFIAHSKMQQGVYQSNDQETSSGLRDNPSYWEAHSWDASEPKVYSIHDGLPSYVGVYHGFGNAIVPQVAAEVIAAYMEVA